MVSLSIGWKTGRDPSQRVTVGVLSIRVCERSAANARPEAIGRLRAFAGLCSTRFRSQAGGHVVDPAAVGHSSGNRGSSVAEYRGWSPSTAFSTSGRKCR